MYQVGELNEVDYAFVINRDITRWVQDMKQSWPQTRAYLQETITDIRNREHEIYRYSYSTSLGFGRLVSVKANGELKLEASILSDGELTVTEDRLIELTPEQINQLQQSINQLQPLALDVPPLLGQGFTSITVYNAGEFITYDDAEQPDDPARAALIELVESWLD